MTLSTINRSRKERTQLWVAISIVFALSFFRLLVEVQSQIDSFFAAYTEFPVAVFVLNLVFFWLLFLLWVAYRRWREAILAEQELEAILMSISPDSLVVINRDRIITMCSGQVETMFGLTEKELIGKKTDVLYYDRRLHGEKGEIASRLERFGFHVGYATGKRKDGSNFPLEIVTGTIRFQQGAVILMRDITERCQAEDALRYSEMRFEQFMRHFPGFAFIKDKEGRRVYLNDAYKFERGWDLDLSLGKTDAELYREDLAQQYRATDEQVLKEDKVLRYVTRIAESDGKVRSLLTVKFPLPVGGMEGNKRLVAGLSLDISEQEEAERERLKMEQQMQQAQKLESLGVLAGGIAHDFNNLLMGIIGHADLALTGAEKAQNVTLHIRSVLSSCQKAADLANQLLAYSGKGSAVFESANLSDLVSDLSGLFKVSITKKAALDLSLAENLPFVECDVTQIRQVLMNLIVNGSDALGGKMGTLSIKTGMKRMPENAAMATKVQRIYPDMKELAESDYVFMQVSDTGSGMDEETIQSIFDPFFTTKKTGHGLGLAAVLGIVRSHRGAIEIESALGQGSVFTVYLPVSSSPVVPENSEPEESSDWTGSGTIIIADDEDMVREVATMMLESIGFTVIAVSSGKQVLDAYKEEKNNIKAMILDINMPDLGGMDIYGMLRKENDDMPVVISSGYNKNESDHDFVHSNKLYYLKKPYRLSVLRSAMREVFSAP